MTKEDYREKVEEHRQEIDLHKESGSKVSRVSRHRKKGAPKRKSPFMTILVFVLIFIPLCILGYVWLIYEPDTATNDMVKAEDKDNLVVEIQKQDPQANKAVDSEEKEDNATEKQEGKAPTDAKAEKEKQRLAAEEAKKAEDAKNAEMKKIEEAQKVAAQKAKELEEKKKAEQASKGEQKTHTVQSTDNLYRIALKYYGSGSPANIEKIKAANNLSSDSISAGQVLVIAP